MPGLAHATAGFIRGSPGACPVLPGVILALRATREPNPADLRLGWDLDPASAYYRVYSVSGKLDMAPPPAGGGPPRGSHPAATLRCSTPDAGTTECVHAGGIDPAAGLTLFYQAVGVCSPGDVEGPN